jgi:hypothetical protein
MCHYHLDCQPAAVRPTDARWRKFQERCPAQPTGSGRMVTGSRAIRRRVGGQAPAVPRPFRPRCVVAQPAGLVSQWAKAQDG